MMLQPVLVLVRTGLAIVLGTAGLAKLADRSGSRQAMMEFGVPAGLGVVGYQLARGRHPDCVVAAPSKADNQRLTSAGDPSTNQASGSASTLPTLISRTLPTGPSASSAGENVRW